MHDVIIVGAGPAGLSAALVLGRCRRRVLVCDAGAPRNAKSQGLHCFLTRDGILPSELLRLGRDQLQRYATVELREAEVTDAAREPDLFTVTLNGGERVTSKKLLLATGVIDRLPNIEGIDDLYGRSVFHCPYCDGWEVADRRIAVYGRGSHGRGLALELTAWSRDLVLCTDGPTELESTELAQLSRNGILVVEEPIARLQGTNGALENIIFENGSVLERQALFFSTGQSQGSNLPAKLGCQFTERGAVWTGEYEATNVPGLYVAGDASRLVQLAVIAAAEGAEAAFAINTSLLKEAVD